MESQILNPQIIISIYLCANGCPSCIYDHILMHSTIIKMGV